MAVKRIVNLPPIEIEVQRVDGQFVTLKARNMKIDEYIKIDEFDLGEDKKMILPNKLAYIFGGKPEDYFVFDARTAISIFNTFLTEIRNPTIQS